MVKAIICFILILVLANSCSINGNIEESEFIGSYSVLEPSSYFKDSLRVFRYFSKSRDYNSIEYFNYRRNEFIGSDLEILDNNTFVIRNNLIRDSIGTWNFSYSPEFGTRLILDFNNANVGGSFIYDTDSIRILELPNVIFKDSIPRDIYKPAEIKILYNKN